MSSHGVSIPEGFNEMQTDAQLAPEEEKKNTLDYYISQIDSTTVSIMKLCDASVGSYLEIAYEMSWEEVMDVLEILEIKEEQEYREYLRNK